MYFLQFLNEFDLLSIPNNDQWLKKNLINSELIMFKYKYPLFAARAVDRSTSWVERWWRRPPIPTLRSWSGGSTADRSTIPVKIFSSRIMNFWTEPVYRWNIRTITGKEDTSSSQIRYGRKKLVSLDWKAFLFVNCWSNDTSSKMPFNHLIENRKIDYPFIISIVKIPGIKRKVKSIN